MTTALITGASSGIGYDLAHLFARDGHDLVLVARGEAKLRALAAELASKHGVRADVVIADLSDPASPQRVWNSVSHEVDVLVNNAGDGLAGPFAETDLETEMAMIQRTSPRSRT